MNATQRVILTLLGIFVLPALAQGPLDRLLAPIAAQPPDVAAPAIRHSASVGQTLSTTLGADVLIVELEKELGARLSLSGDLKLTLAQQWQPLKLPASDFALAITESPSAGIAGTFVIRVRITSGEAAVADLPISLRAQLFQEVWTAADRVERGQSLDRTLLTTSKVDVLRERQPPLLADVDPSAFDAVQPIAAGRCITRRDVIERPIVRRGQVVEVIAHHGQLAIRMKALALESGASGSLIKLRNIESRKEFSGQILNENKVQVHF